MAKILYLKNNVNTNGKQKFVFMSVEKPSGQAPQAGGGFSEFIEHKFNTKLNLESKFNTDPNAFLKDLGDKAHEKNPSLNPESIKNNMVKALDNGKTLEEVWDYLQKNDCTSASIIEGQLRFFTGTKEISITQFFKPIDMEIGGEDTVTGQYLERRKKMMDGTMQALQALRGELPENSPNKIS